MNPLDIKCPHCKSEPGVLCVRFEVEPYMYEGKPQLHMLRLQAAFMADPRGDRLNWNTWNSLWVEDYEQRLKEGRLAKPRAEEPSDVLPDLEFDDPQGLSDLV